MYSDGNGTIDEILSKARERRLDGIAITDHDTTVGALKACRKAKNLIVIPGYEVCTRAGHLLALGIEKTLPAKLNYEEVIDCVRELNGITILAHPLTGKSRLQQWMKYKPDAIETINALYPLFNYQTRKGHRLASNLNLPEVGGSDAHDPLNVGDAYTIVESNGKEVEDVLEGIRKSMTKAEGNSSPIITRLKVGYNFMLLSIMENLRGY
jgi:hypothetical protein